MNNRAFLPSLSFHTSAHQIAVAMIALSVINALIGSTALLLIPYATVNNFELWRPFTALLIAVNPVEIILGGLIIYSIGGALEQSWGKRRFLMVSLGIPLLGELAAVIACTVLPVTPQIAYHGASIIISTIWIAYGLRAAFSGQLLNFWGSPLKGETFALIGLGFVVLNGVFAGIMVVLPDLFAAAFTYLYMYRRGTLNLAEIRRRIELAYYNWKLKRLKKKSGLRVVKGSREDDDSKPRYH